MRTLSESRTEIKARPPRASSTPAPNCAFAYASSKFSPTPITSPVERISGPKIGSTPWNLANGNTTSLTEKNGGIISFVTPCDSND